MSDINRFVGDFWKVAVNVSQCLWNWNLPINLRDNTVSSDME